MLKVTEGEGEERQDTLLSGGHSEEITAVPRMTKVTEPR